MFWFRKFLAIVSVSLGVALMVLPFPAQLSGERTAEVVHLEAAPAPYDNRDWSPMSRPDAADLAGFPELKAALERLAAGPLPAADGREVPVAQWRSFHRRHLDRLEFRPAFVVLGRLFTGAVEEELAPWTLATPWLRPAARVGGGVLLALGLVLLVASYRAGARRPGIAVAPVALALLCDAISLAGGVFFAALALDTLWVGPLGQTSLLGLVPEWPSTQAITGLHFISLPVMLVALPLLTLFFTSLSVQRIQVDEAGVTSHGALGSTSLAWQDLERVRLREQRNPFAFTVLDFRRLQKVLDLEAEKRSITVNEPASRARKARLVEALRQHAPAAKRALLDGLEGW